MKMRDQYTCPLELTHDITRGKWKPMILWQLAKGPASLSQLVKDIRGITQKNVIRASKRFNGIQHCRKKPLLKDIH